MSQNQYTPCIVCGKPSRVPICGKCQASHATDNIHVIGQPKKWETAADRMYQARMKMTKDAHVCLAAAIEDMSQRCYGKDWHEGFEYELWFALDSGGPVDQKLGNYTFTANDQLRIMVLCENAGIWFQRQDDSYTPVPLPLWMQVVQQAAMGEE